MTRIAVTGYAGLDHVLQLEASPRPNETVIAGRAGSGWRRLGGCPAYIALALVRAGHHDVIPVTWVGDDEDGDRFAAALREAGVSTQGVVATVGEKTPVCILAYDPAGACYCIYDPVASRNAVLTPHQRDIVASADWVCVSVGPAGATRAVLQALSPGQKLLWAVKADGDAFPTDVRAALAARADVIVHSRSERSFIAEALAGPERAGRVMVETRGADGVVLSFGGRRETVPARQIAAPDPTGAGDTLIGGLLAALAATPDDPVAAVRAGQDAAHAMLMERSMETKARIAV